MKLYHVLAVPFGGSKFKFVEAFLHEDWHWAMKLAARLRDDDLKWADAKVVPVEEDDEEEGEETPEVAAAEPGKVYLFLSSYTLFGGASHGDDSVPPAG